MPTNDLNGANMPVGEGVQAVREFPDEAGEKKKKDRLVITGGAFGPQLMVIPSPELYPDEEDPNP